MKNPAHSEVSTSRSLFVLSVWRSGSSLLYALLNKHPQIALLYEGELPQLQPLLKGHFRDGSWREKWEFWNEGPSRHGIPLESMPPQVPDAWEATRIVYQEFARRKKANIWGEKSPHWYDNALQIAEKFPDAQYIFLWRDVNGVMKSIQRAAATERFFRKPGLLTRVLLGTEKLRNACDQLKTQGRSVHELNYEDLTAKPTECLNDICEFLHIPFDPQVAFLESADRSALFSGDHHAMVNGDRIVGKRMRAQVLPHRTESKIARYVCRWKQRSAGSWPQYPTRVSKHIDPPSTLELVRDLILYRALQCSDAAVKLTYAAVPVSFARSLRSWLRHRTFTKGLLQLSR